MAATRSQENSCGGAPVWGLHMMGPVMKGLYETEVMTVGKNDYIRTRVKISVGLAGSSQAVPGRTTEEPSGPGQTEGLV
ncbi:unnamed protein product [Arctogadus glacialis]